MGGELERLEKAESELKERIAVKEKEVEALMQETDALKHELDRIDQVIHDDLVALVQNTDYDLRTMFEYPKDPSEVLRRLRQLEGNRRKEYESAKSLGDFLEEKIRQTKLAELMDALRELETRREKTSEDLSSLRSKYHHFFGERDSFDWRTVE